MKEANRLRLGTLFYWASLTCCVLVAITNGFSVAGNGYSVDEEQPCVVTNADCPKCTELADTGPYNAFYGMAGETIFRRQGEKTGDHYYNGSFLMDCYKTAMCTLIKRDETLQCFPDRGCDSYALPTGCNKFRQELWVTISYTYEMWPKDSED